MPKVGINNSLPHQLAALRNHPVLHERKPSLPPLTFSPLLMEPMIDSSSSIPELIKYIKHSFRECEYDQAQTILVEREKGLKTQIQNLVGERDELNKKVEFLDNSKAFTELEKCDLEDKLRRSQKRCVEFDIMKKKYEKLQTIQLNFEDKLWGSERRGEELDKIIVQMNVKFEKLRGEKTDVEEKLVRSSEKLGEMDQRMVEMGKEIEELRREKLSASKTIEELKVKGVEAKIVAQELKRQNAEALQTIEKLKVKQMKSDKAIGFCENDLDPRISKLERALAKMLSVNVEDLACLEKGDGSVAQVNLQEEDRAIVSREAPAVSGKLKPLIC